MRLLLALFFATTLVAAAQPPQVPHKMNFAGITLTIRDDARKEIQKDVDALTQSPKHFNIKVERAKTYFPIIEKIFEEERVPDDFKFLVLQESALIPDAVSVSNAVGFWQFKDFTAMEMGMRVDKEIDERMNIASASRGAARYIKKNNFYFNNWIYALQAYQMGAGGVLKVVNESQNGAKHMEINSKTYWYVKKFLAHKIAFQDAVSGTGQIQVITYQNSNKKSLADLAKEVSVAEADLTVYNKWAKKGVIPDDRQYTVLIPVIGNVKDITLPTTVAATLPSAKAEPGKVNVVGSASLVQPDKIRINGISAIKSNEGENSARLSERAGVDLSDFLSWNDISISDRIVPNQFYLLGKKRNRASESYHKVSSGESLWQISQRYGVKMSKLKKFNRLDSDRDVKPDMMLWLTATKPKGSDKAVEDSEVVMVDNSQTFSWAVNPEQSSEAPVIRAAASINKPITSTESPIVEKSATSLEEEVETENSGDDNQVVNQIATKDEHKVQAGETLYGIAQQHKVSVMDLVTWNSLNLQEGIKTGQVLKVIGEKPEIENTAKAVEPAMKAEIQHEVKSTDTLYSIARKYGVTIQDLMEWNDKKDFTVSVGEKLKVNQR
ncbi:MAG TPA: LysM peptidoglycan-binding domain-containing protein [Chryseolinea sp.]|nr:LysM peptidoglycan-binding domain-containing protein [Chryseolinea sp.]HPH46589.1 LysM peptidoglycan-binding domain-containing protein [Chryseolinea sp.]HPM32924.1 LysM peptidoglycan-binding domain-containing protein [Chryseolinea sp.]